MPLIFMAATEQLELTADYPRANIFSPRTNLQFICSLSRISAILSVAL